MERWKKRGRRMRRRKRRRRSEEAKDWRGSKRNLIEVKPSRLFVKEGGKELRGNRLCLTGRLSKAEINGQRLKGHKRWTGQTNRKGKGSKDIEYGQDRRIGRSKPRKDIQEERDKGIERATN